jgi:hypothetical protein
MAESPNRIHTSTPSNTAEPPKMSGFRRPNLSETKPNSGQPIIKPSGTITSGSAFGGGLDLTVGGWKGTHTNA